MKYHQKLMSKQTQVFAEYKLKSIKKFFIIFLVKIHFVRYIYYCLAKKILLELMPKVRTETLFIHLFYILISIIISVYPIG